MCSHYPQQDRFRYALSWFGKDGDLCQSLDIFNLFFYGDIFFPFGSFLKGSWTLRGWAQGSNMETPH